jgi:hypothetical protein
VILILWIIFAVLAILCAILLGSKIEGNIKLIPTQQDHKLHVSAHALWGLIHYVYESPPIDRGILDRWVHPSKVPAVSPHASKILKDIWITYHKYVYLRHHMYHFPHIQRSFLKQMTCHQFLWNTNLGLREAPRTAIYAGSVWLVQSWLVRWLFQKITLRCKPRLWVKPHYHEFHLSMQLQMHMSIRMLSIMGLFCRLFYSFFRSRDRLQIISVMWPALGWRKP